MMTMIKRGTHAFKNRINRLYIGILKIPMILLKIKKNKVIFINYHGKGYGDNLKYVANELMNYPDVDMVWLLRKNAEGRCGIPENIRIAPYDSFRGLLEMATAKVWIANCRKIFCPIKKKNQYYIQTWHGGIALKKVEGDAEDSLNPYYIKCAHRDTKYADVMISNSKICTEMYNRAFWYHGEILECGSPRNDILISHDEKLVKRIKCDLNISGDEKIVLYCPTFRDGYNLSDAYIEDYESVINAFEVLTNEKIIVLVRLHPNMSEVAEQIVFSSRIINVTNYPDMQELMIVSDYAISDYSSSSIEFSMLRRPVFLLVKDYTDYVKERGMFFDLEKLPYIKCFTEAELKNNIIKFDVERYNKELEEFFDLLEVKESGEASRCVADVVLKKLN